MSAATFASARQHAFDWLRRGQAQEAQGTPEALAQALACYGRVVALLEALPSAAAERELGIARMNEGNVLQKLARYDDAARAYDAAIGSLQDLAATGDRAAVNSLGAAWMNRGHALQLSNTPDALAEALRSHDAAITLLQTLPTHEHPAYRANLAGAWLNRAQVLLASSRPEFAAVQAALATTLALAAPAEKHDPLVADISLKARHAHCAALTRELTASSAEARAELIAQTGDAIDDAMLLVRHWEQAHPHRFRPIAGDLYRFGAQFYLAHQPRFLAEFLLENLDPARTAGAMPAAAELHAIAAEAIARALADTYNRRLAAPTGEDAARLQEVAEALNVAEARRIQLQQAHAGATA